MSLNAANAILEIVLIDSKGEKVLVQKINATDIQNDQIRINTEFLSNPGCYTLMLKK